MEDTKDSNKINIENLIKKNEFITWRDKKYYYNGYEKLDENMVHIFLDNDTICFMAKYLKINNVLCESSDEIISMIEK